MNTPEVITAIAAPSTLAALGLLVVACAREWITVSVAVSVRAVPGAKRKPRNAVEVVLPAAQDGGQGASKPLPRAA